MQTVIGSGSWAYATQAMGVRVLLLSDAPDGRTAQHLASCGSLVDVEESLDSALARLRDDAIGFDLFVMDCDAFGGISAGERAVVALIAAEARMRVMLISRDFDEPALPFGRRTAVCLPAGLGDTDFRRGFDHVLRDRISLAVM
jgi:hypothetical protein